MKPVPSLEEYKAWRGELFYQDRPDDVEYTLTWGEQYDLLEGVTWKILGLLAEKNHPDLEEVKEWAWYILQQMGGIYRFHRLEAAMPVLHMFLKKDHHPSLEEFKDWNKYFQSLHGGKLKQKEAMKKALKMLETDPSFKPFWPST